MTPELRIPRCYFSLFVLAIVWLVLMVGVFYLLLWRPQQRRMALVRSLQGHLELGDDVLTTSGIFGQIVELGDDDLRPRDRARHGRPRRARRDRRAPHRRSRDATPSEATEEAGR